MTKAADTWMPLYIGDYLADTLHLTRDQHGAYLLIIMAYWRNSGPLPDDDDGLAAITKSHPNEWKKLRPVMTRFFRIDSEGWHHKRIDAELGTSHRLAKVRSESGARGAAKRWQADSKTIARPLARPLANASQIDAPSQSQSQKEKGEATPVGVGKSEKKVSRPAVAAGGGARPPPALSRSPHTPTNPSSPVASDGRSRKARPRQQLKPDWQLDLAGHRHAAEHGWEPARIAEQAAAFRDHHLAKGTLAADWGAAWRTWVRKTDEYAARDTARGNGHRRHPPAKSASVAAVFGELAAEYKRRGE